MTVHVDDVNDAAGRLQAEQIALNQETTGLVDAVNHRFARLRAALRVRLAAMQQALSDFGPSSQHFLISSVQPPWQRAISANRLPYYIE
jgi:hypothetical protein